MSSFEAEDMDLKKKKKKKNFMPPHPTPPPFEEWLKGHNSLTLDMLNKLRCHTHF